MTQVEQLKQMLVEHDWWYAMSDNHNVWRNGRNNWDKIVSLAEKANRMDVVNTAVRAFNDGRSVQEALGEAV